MDVTFTNVLEGARQYFQGLPLGSTSSANSIYPTSEPQRINNDIPRSQELHPSTSPYWIGQTDTHRLPSREPTPVQRPPSYSSDSSRPPSHSLYVATSQEQRRTPNYTSYPDQPSHFQQSNHQLQQNLQQQQHQQQQQLHGQQLHTTEQLLQPQTSQQNNQDFQFTRPHYREAPSNTPHHYPSHILQNPAYHLPPSPHNSVSPHHQSASTKQQRKLEQSSSTSSHSPHHSQMIQQPIQSSASYSGYQQNRAYYPATSYPNAQTSIESKNLQTSQGYQYQPSQINNPSYYKNMYYSQTSSSSAQFNNSSTVIQNTQSMKHGQTSKTHNLPPIAQLSESYSKSVRENQKQSIIRNQSNMSNNMSSQVNSLSTTSMQSTTNQINPENRMEYHHQYQNRTTGQPYIPSASTITTTSLSYNTVSTCRSNNTFSVQTLSSSATKQHQQNSTMSHDSFNNFNIGKPSQQYAASNTNHNSSDVKKQLSNKQKRESPLDLSVKTVRTPADSTLDDTEGDKQQYSQSNRATHIATSNYPTYDPFGSSYQRNNNSTNSQQRVPSTQPVGIPKIDFSPNFSISAMTNTHPPPRQNQRNALSSYSQVPARSTVPPPLENSVARENNNPSRYPTVTVPSIASVNNYMQGKTNNKNVSKNLPKMDFPSIENSLKASAMYPNQNTDTHKKRPADTAPSLTSKIARVESWRQTIDQQIEQKLSTYKQVQNSPKKPAPSKSIPVQNGTYHASVQENPKDMYNKYARPQYPVGVPPQQSYINQYQAHSNHNQTYVPSPVSQPFSAGSNYPTHHQNMFPLNDMARTNPNVPSSVKTSPSGAADKRVLTLLRNSIETKGVKEAQRKYEQEQFGKYLEQPHHRSDIQHPSTHVTAPIQPKPSFMGRHNVSPFTPNSLPEGNNTTPLFNKLHVPRAIDSINFGTSKESDMMMNNKQLTETVINDQNNPNGDLDGLAAFLAARIRTKAELKQVSPSQQVNKSTSNLYNLAENRTPHKQDLSSSFTSGSSVSVSPPKLLKEFHQSQQPRKRLFSRTEEDSSSAKGFPCRDKSGMRSSSETSVFDFPDSGSDGEMPVLEMQSLNAMRKDRKSSLKMSSSNVGTKELKSEESSPQRPLTPEDDIFLQACDTFMDQLKAGVGKKRGRRKKGVEPEALAQLETVTKENPLNVDSISIDVNVKEEKNDEDINGKVNEMNLCSEISESNETTGNLITTKMIQPSTEFLSDSQQITPQIKQEMPDTVDEHNVNCVTIVTKQENDLSDSESETIKQLCTKIKNKSLDKTDIESETKIKTTELLTLTTKAVKKPAFGDGSAFYPGWEEEVYKYKKSLRMPPSLIQVTRPPSAMRLSTSLPDLDPCPSSPTSSINPDKDEDTKTVFTKIKSEPLDSDDESNSGFNVFGNKINYDSEGSASISSLPVKDSIVDKLLQKCGKRKKRKYKKKEEQGPKIIPKAENPVELLPTPSLEMKKDNKKSKEPVIKVESPLLGFRKKTIENFKDAFLSRANNIVGVNEQFSTVILKSRTRKETRVMKQRATIKEVFGEDRPASAPPVTCINMETKKEIEKEVTKEKEIISTKASPKHLGKTKIVGRGRPKNNLLKSLADKKLKNEIAEDAITDYEQSSCKSRDQSPSTFSEDLDSKSETPSLDGEENGSVVSMKRRGKFNKIRRKFSSGFDYIRKKKKQVKKENDPNDVGAKRKRGLPTLKATPESEQDIRKEIKSWVLNKGIGETHLHRSARLGYTDITAFCLEKMECSPSPKDNAGYTPLHEACSRGHLDIARLLLMYGANVSESAKGGVRPLHEAVENGFVEIIRLLLSYGADPKLATYAGLTPLALATDESTRELLLNHMNDLEGKSTASWSFNGPASCFDPKDNGYSVLSSPPNSEPLSEEEEEIEIEVSETLLPNLYTLRGEAQNDRWILLQDISNILKIKSRDALLKQLCPAPAPGTSSNSKTFLRELKMSDFLEQAHCCQFLNASEKINPRASKIALIKYTDKIRELLKVEKVVITAR